MSYDLAVWEGAADSSEYERLYDVYLESGDPVEPSPRVVAYLKALVDLYPEDDEGPWSSTPLLAGASGPLVELCMSWSRCDEVSEAAARLAEKHGLNCFDPQREELRTPDGRAWRHELTSARGRKFRDPTPDRVRQVVSQVSADYFWAVLARSDDWYMQVGYGERVGVRPGWYALERRDGSPDRHYRAVVTNVEEVVTAFEAFLRGDPAIPRRFPWEPYVV